MKQLVFDTTVTDDDRDNVGAYLRAGTDGDAISSGTGASDNVANTFEGLDVRAFAFGYDSGGDNWDRIQAVAGAMKVYIDDGDFEVDVVINAEKAEDSAHSSADVGNYVLAVRADTRPTNANTSADGDYASFFVNDSGELYVKDTDAAALLTTIDADTSAIATDIAAIETELLDQGTTLDAILADTANIDTNVATIAGDTTSIDATLTALSKAEDAAHSSGDQGIMALAVRSDADTALAADGDYIPFSMNSSGHLRVNLASGSVTTSDAALANTDFAVSQNSVTTTSESVVSALSSRKYLFIRNEGNKKVFIGKTTATDSDFPISPGETLILRAGAALDFKAITSSGTADLRTLELS